MLQLCNFDLKSPTLNERIGVAFAFPGHLAADALRSSLTDLLDVRPESVSHEFGCHNIINMADFVQRFPVCCGRLSINKREGFLICNSAGKSFIINNFSAYWLMCKAASVTSAILLLLLLPALQ